MLRLKKEVNHQLPFMDKRPPPQPPSKTKKKDSGGDHSAPRVPLHSEQKKGFVWFRVLMRWDKENQDMSRDIKNELLYQTSLECTRCPWMHVNVWRLIIHNKRMYSHLYRGVGLICFLMKKAPPFFIVFTTYSTTGLDVHLSKHASVADGIYIYIYICTLIHTVHTVREHSRHVRGRKS